jgi:hypothetical protein
VDTYYKTLTDDHRGGYWEFDYSAYLPGGDHAGEWLPDIDYLDFSNDGYPVDSYRDAHPDCDLLYYDALELASPEWSAKVKAWSADYQKRRAAYKQWSDNLKPLTFPE